MIELTHRIGGPCQIQSSSAYHYHEYRINTAVYQVFFIESFSIVFSMYIFNPATGNFSCIASNVMLFTVVDDYDQSFFAFFFNKNAYRTPRRPSDPIRLYATPISEILQISLTSSQYEWFQS